jgi:hypothetical protein
MRPVLRGAMLVGLLLLPLGLEAQIYTCRGADGSRVYSDQKCGTDAQPVKGFEKVKRKKNSKTKAAEPKPTTPPKPPEELAELLKQCDVGNTQACTTWTLSGGPAALRQVEEGAERACEGGSRTDCETRYCREGANEVCRQSVLRTAELSGENWYLRKANARATDGSQTYDVRCIHKDVPKTNDVTITCKQGPTRRCLAGNSASEFDGLREAADRSCTAASNSPKRSGGAPSR